MPEIECPYGLILYFGSDHLSFLTNKVQADNHSHNYIQLTIGLQQDVVITVEEQAYQASGFILQSNVIHELHGLGQWQWYMLINPESAFGEHLKRTYLQNSKMHVLSSIQIEALQHLAIAQLFSIKDPDDYGSTWSTCKHILGFPDNSLSNLQSVLDERLHSIMQAIETIPAHQLTVKTLSKKLFLSESRLSHLFKNRAGISLASYLVHHKLETAFHAIFNGKPMTEAAMDAGFNSSSHFSRTVRDKLGMTARAIVQHSRYLKV
ncbi:AraC family transcriptional regulator [Paenibacillus sp. S-12]|uniref:helix-turn-helix domain-containing protein n=1 Tax=Paenibacillus sp. S-12 TaxID=3031371 RepID=UPI0025A2EFCF|nr:AraC family transcriptional regulator [Paenibacillus sp. S-12]